MIVMALFIILLYAPITTKLVLFVSFFDTQQIILIFLF